MSVTPYEQLVIPKLKRQTMETLLAKNARLDGRRLSEYRPIEILPGYIERAEGSALVRLGSTVVLVGVKTELGQPFPDTPEEGILIVNAEFVPLASPTFEPGPPDENAIELARVIDRSLREIRAVALDKLVIEPGKTVWKVYVDIYVLNHSGNLVDASMLAAMSALLSTRLPAVIAKEDGYVIDRTRYVSMLPVNHIVVTSTVTKIANKLLLDPSYEEETVADVRLVVAVSDDGRLVGMQKMGMGYLTEAELDQAVQMALRASAMLIEKVKETVMPYREKEEAKLKETTVEAEAVEEQSNEAKTQAEKSEEEEGQGGEEGNGEGTS